jgi:hypothetical protein
MIYEFRRKVAFFRVLLEVVIHSSRNPASFGDSGSLNPSSLLPTIKTSMLHLQVKGSALSLKSQYQSSVGESCLTAFL